MTQEEIQDQRNYEETTVSTISGRLLSVRGKRRDGICIHIISRLWILMEFI